MAADNIPRRPDQPPGQSRSPGRRLTVKKLAIGTGLVAYSWFAASTEPFTRDALLIVLVPGAVIGFLAYGRPPARIPPPQSLDITGFSYWAITVAILFEWEAAAFKDNSQWWHPALTNLVDPMLGTHPVKALAILIWLLAGWGLVRR
jgi:hypothetical protein